MSLCLFCRAVIYGDIALQEICNNMWSRSECKVSDAPMLLANNPILVYIFVMYVIL